MRRWLVRGLVVALAVITTASAKSAQPAAKLSVADAVAVYERGDFSDAVSNLDTRQLMVAPFTRALDGWIAAGEAASAPRRQIVAAAFALDAVWAASRTLFNARETIRDPWKNVSPNDPERWSLADYHSQPVVARWAVQQLPATGTPDFLEHTLWLVAVGIAEDGHAWYRLQNDVLPRALERLPDEPRLRLAGVLARTNIDLGSLRTGPNLPYRSNEILREEHLPAGVTGRVPDAIRELEPLLAEPTLAGEIELRIGYLELRRGKWTDALAHFDAARSKVTEPTLLAAADYFAGWVHEQQDRPDDAITAYRRAFAITPTMRNLATRLSALLYLRNERTEAYAILDPALNVRPAPIDLLVAVERADARFVPEWLMSIRKALQ